MSTWEPPTGPVQLPAQPRGSRTGWIVTLVVVAVLLGALAFWAHLSAGDRSAEADGLTQAVARVDDQAKHQAEAGDNDALSDTKRTREVTDYVTTAVEATFSYDYANLAATEQAVDEHLTGKARCVYEALFDEVKRVAPEQKVTLKTTVHEVALVSLGKADAQALVYIDQVSTRADTQKSTTVGGQLAVGLAHDGTRWTVSDFDLFGQPLYNGEPAPKC